jgi:outer membrane protein assembly factor BamB
MTAGEIITKSWQSFKGNMRLEPTTKDLKGEASRNLERLIHMKTLNWLLTLSITACGIATIEPTAKPTNTRPVPTPFPTEPSAPPLETVLYQADLQRTGVYDLSAIKQRPEVLWEADLGAELMGALLYADGALYIGAYDGTFYALESETGETLWTVKTSDPIEKALAVRGEAVIVGGFDGVIDAFNRQDGSVLWSFEAGAPAHAAPLIEGERVFIATGSGMLALDVSTGERIWQSAISNEGGNIGSPALEGDRVFVSIGNTLAAVDKATGEALWRVQSETFYWGLALANDYVYVGNSDGYFYAYAQDTGEEVWKFKAEFTGDFDYWSAPAISGDVLFVGNLDQNLYALNAISGEQLWIFKTRDAAISDPILTDGVIYISDGDHLTSMGERYLYALDAQSGEVLWDYSIRSTQLTVPTLGGDVIFIASTGKVIALR